MKKKQYWYDFKSFGQAIKEAREEKGMTREQVAGIVDLAPRYLCLLYTSDAADD